MSPGHAPVRMLADISRPRERRELPPSARGKIGLRDTARQAQGEHQALLRAAGGIVERDLRGRLGGKIGGQILGDAKAPSPKAGMGPRSDPKVRRTCPVFQIVDALRPGTREARDLVLPEPCGFERADGLQIQVSRGVSVRAAGEERFIPGERRPRLDL